MSFVKQTQKLSNVSCEKYLTMDWHIRFSTSSVDVAKPKLSVSVTRLIYLGLDHERHLSVSPFPSKFFLFHITENAKLSVMTGKSSNDEVTF